jgi:hypothetical protein
VRDPVRITRIADHRGKPLGQAQAPLGRGQQQDAAVRGDPSAVERGCDLFASGSMRWRGLALTTESYATSIA